MKYSVCVPAVFGGTPLAQALGKVREAGAQAFEIWGWNEKDLDTLESGIAEHGLEMAAMCTRLIPLNDPQRRAEFMDGLRVSIAAAQRLGCPVLIAQAGQTLEGVERGKQHACIVEGLREAARLLEGSGVVLALEPLNALVDHKGYYLTSSQEAFDIVREAGSDSVRVLFDVYHQQITEGNLMANISANPELIAHMHIAGVPGRHEPLQDCEINYPALFDKLRALGYAGYIGLEYMPKGDPMQSIRQILALNAAGASHED